MDDSIKISYLMYERGIWEIFYGAKLIVAWKFYWNSFVLDFGVCMFM